MTQRMSARRREWWENGNPNADTPKGAHNVIGPANAPQMPLYDGLVFNTFCIVCMEQLTGTNRDCGCVDYRGLPRSQCQDGLFFATLRMKNAWIVLRKNRRRERGKAHKKAWHLWRMSQRDLLVFGHPVLRKFIGNGGGTPQVGNHVRPFMEFVFTNYASMGSNNCVVCGDDLVVNRSYNFCNTCKAWPIFQQIWAHVSTTHGRPAHIRFMRTRTPQRVQQQPLNG